MPHTMAAEGGKLCCNPPCAFSPWGARHFQKTLCSLVHVVTQELNAVLERGVGWRHSYGSGVMPSFQSIIRQEHRAGVRRGLFNASFGSKRDRRWGVRVLFGSRGRLGRELSCETVGFLRGCGEDLNGGFPHFPW